MKRMVVAATSIEQTFDIDLTALYLHIGGDLPAPSREQDFSVGRYYTLFVDGDGFETDPYIDLYKDTNFIVSDGETVTAVDLGDGTVKFTPQDNEYDLDFVLPMDLAKVVGFNS